MKLVIEFPLWRAHPFTFSKASWICIWNTGDAQAARSELSVVISVTHSDRRLFPVPYSLCCGLNTQAVWVADLHTLILLCSKMKSKCKLRENLFVFINNSNFKMLIYFAVFKCEHSHL